MKKKVLGIALFALLLAAVMSAGLYAFAEDEFVCEIEGFGYAALDDALAAVPDNTPTTIKFLTDITCGQYDETTEDFQVLTIENKQIDFDLNGYEWLFKATSFTLGNSDITINGDLSVYIAEVYLFTNSKLTISNNLDAYGIWLEVCDSDMVINGKFSVFQSAVQIDDNSNLTINDGFISTYDTMMGAINGSSITVYGNMTISGDDAIIGAIENSILTVNGDITFDIKHYNPEGHIICRSQSELNINGNITSKSHSAVVMVTDKSNANITGDINAVLMPIYVAEGGTATVGGNITVSSKLGLLYSGWICGGFLYNGDLTVGGDIIVYDFDIGEAGGSGIVPGTGAVIIESGNLVVNGKIIASQYITFDDVLYTIDDKAAVSSKPGYDEYTDGAGYVWVKIPSAPPVAYTVSFDVDGAVTAVQVADGALAAKPADPAKEGYAFSGWRTGSGAGGVLFDFNAPITGDVTLYASWTEATDPGPDPDPTPWNFFAWLCSIIQAIILFFQNLFN
ncbi:MAG: InlB B-repeat-containing protein [Oscillospiraceae bacterium]|nr:InlB B-repeat-containing protein [Oscillospiraceae bacterium]